MDIISIGRKYVLLGVDYFSRALMAKVLVNKSAKEVTRVLKRWFENTIRPVELITDNGKEFDNEEVKKLCWDFGVERRLVGVEAHRSNGRVERAIRTIREGLLKARNDTLENMLNEVVRTYNRTYHSAIKSTPDEAWSDYTGIAQLENSSRGSYAKRFVMRGRGKFESGQKVRITQRENLGGRTKNIKGRFMREGEILARCGDDAYLVKEEDKIFKKCHYDLKGK